MIRTREDVNTPPPPSALQSSLPSTVEDVRTSTVEGKGSSTVEDIESATVEGRESSTVVDSLFSTVEGSTASTVEVDLSSTVEETLWSTDKSFGTGVEVVVGASPTGRNRNKSPIPS